VADDSGCYGGRHRSLPIYHHNRAEKDEVDVHGGSGAKAGSPRGGRPAESGDITQALDFVPRRPWPESLNVGLAQWEGQMATHRQSGVTVTGQIVDMALQANGQILVAVPVLTVNGVSGEQDAVAEWRA
jgi:hypothetical protein